MDIFASSPYEVCRRNRLPRSFGKRGVGVARTYPETMCQQPPAAAAYRASDLVHSRAFCRSVINLPLFAQISDSEVMYSVDQLLEILEEKF